jgi:hypothetical protein
VRTRLWETTLARRSESDTDLSSDPRERLRVAFMAFRARAQVLAAEINRDLPEFTVHDISHVDSLWEMADLVAGSNYELTPTEAFVLGGAFFVHDLGLSLAAYPDGLEALRHEKTWNDTLAAIWQNRLGRFKEHVHQVVFIVLSLAGLLLPVREFFPRRGARAPTTS